MSCAKGFPVRARKDAFLISENGEIVVYDCPTGFCLDATECGTQPVPNGSIAVSCCAPKRLPAVDENGRINLLCAECAAGLIQVPRARRSAPAASRPTGAAAQIGNRCIPCNSVNGGALFGVIVASYVVVCVFHLM
jgi:hypothetical protein